MKQAFIALSFILGILFLFFAKPAYDTFMDTKYYGEAEPVVDLLKPLFAEHYGKPIESIRSEMVSSLERKAKKGKIVFKKIEFPENEEVLIRVDVNKKYTIDVFEDGAIFWILKDEEREQDDVSI